MQGVLPQGSQLIYSLGNHDVQDQGEFEAFMQAIRQFEEQNQGKKIHILTNTPSLWRSNQLEGRFNTVAYTKNGVGVVSYFTNMAFGGGSGFMLSSAQDEGATGLRPRNI